MAAYGLLVWGQTLLALAGLASAGGWVVWFFRGSDRPYVGLAAPLAGIAALAGALLALYFGCGLPLATSLLLGWLGLSGATAACLTRGGLRRPTRRGAAAGLAAVALASGWGAYAGNWSAVRAGEPTLAVAVGGDEFGYAMAADWLRAHPASEPPRADRLSELFSHVVLHVEGSRPAAFLLTAAAARVRGGGALFSYDWACGVVLAAGVLGLAGLFARGPAGLGLLLAAGVSCAWLAVSRTGFFGKALAYPGCLLLAALYLGAWARPAAGRLAAACLAGPGVAFCLNPVVPFLVVGLLAAGLLAALALRPLARPGGPGGAAGAPPAWRLGLRAVALYLAMTGPSFAAHRLLYRAGYPPYELPWDFVVPVSLDLQTPSLPLVGAGLGPFLVAGYFAADLLLLLAALRRGDAAAASCLMAPALVPFARLTGQTGLYGFHGLLYPLTAAGAALLLGRAEPARPRRRAAALALAAAALVALHLPQIGRAAARYLAPGPAGPVVLTRGDLEAVRRLTAGGPVDVCLAHFCDSLAVLAELGGREDALRLRPPAWEWTLANWAANVGCPSPAGAPKARFSLVERGAFAPPGTVRYRGARLKLCEDSAAVTFLGYGPPQAVAEDDGRGPGLWAGATPAVLGIHNGTGATAAVSFRAEGIPGPGAGGGRLRYRLGDQEGALPLAPAGGPVVIPLRLAPGRHRLTLTAEPAAGAGPPDPDRLVRLAGLTLESLPPGVPAGGDGGPPAATDPGPTRP
jgi:hypothetical protein